jgi:hypothetical protein
MRRKSAAKLIEAEVQLLKGFYIAVRLLTNNPFQAARYFGEVLQGFDYLRAHRCEASLSHLSQSGC